MSISRRVRYEKNIAVLSEPNRSRLQPYASGNGYPESEQRHAGIKLLLKFCSQYASYNLLSLLRAFHMPGYSL